MSTSKGQCCDDCVTTIEYNDNGKRVWNRNFGTDTIDIYSSGDLISIIGNQSLSFQYNDDLIVTNGSGMKEHYFLPFQTNIQNNTIFGQYDIKGKPIYVGFDYALDTNKTYSYSGSSSVKQYSYPLEQYTNSANTKNFRTFHHTSGMFNVSNDKVFGYYINPSSSMFENKNIGFVGAEYRVPSLSGDLIYLGFNKYCHTVLEFPSKFEFTSGSPNNNYDELVNVIFNYDRNHIVRRTTNSGINNDVTLFNYSGNLTSFSFNYTDDKHINNQINFLVKKSSGLQPNAYIYLYDTGCIPKLFLPTSVNDIYRGTGVIDYNGEYYNQFMSYYHYNSDYSGNEICTMSGGNMFKAWKVLGYNVNDSEGRIIINLQRYHNNQDSGASYFRYDQSVSNGYPITPITTGFLPHFVSYYSVTGLRSNINYFQIDNIESSANFANQLQILKNNFVEYDYNDNSFSGGQLFRYGDEVGTWSIDRIGIEALNKVNDDIFTKIDYRFSLQDNSYDYIKKNGSGEHYGMLFSSFLNMYETVTGPDSVTLNYVGVLGSYCGMKNFCGDDMKHIIFSVSKTMSSPTTTSGIDNEISFIGEYDKVGDLSLSNVTHYGSETTYPLTPSGWVVTTYFPVQSVASFAEFYTPKALSVTNLPSNSVCATGGNVVPISSYYPYCFAHNGPGVSLTIQVPSLSYIISPSGWPGNLNGAGRTPFGLTKCMGVTTNFSGPTTFNVALKAMKAFQSYSYPFYAWSGCSSPPYQICYTSGYLTDWTVPALDVEGWLQPVKWSVNLPTGLLNGCYPITIDSGNYYQGIPAIKANDIYVPFFCNIINVCFGYCPVPFYPTWSGAYYGLMCYDVNEYTTYNAGYNRYNNSTPSHFPNCIVNNCISGLFTGFYYDWWFSYIANQSCSGIYIDNYYYLTEGKDWNISGQIDGSNSNSHWTCLPLDVSIPEGMYYGTGAVLKVEGFNNWNYIDPLTSFDFNSNLSGQPYYSKYNDYSCYGILRSNNINLLSKDLNRYDYGL